MAYKIGSTTLIHNSGVIFDHQTELVEEEVVGTNIKITADDGEKDDYFGFAVAVGCGKIVVGAYRNDDEGSDTGSAYIYDLDGTNEIKITASDGAQNDVFGRGVAVGCGKIVVGSNSGTEGAAYIYDLDGTNEIKITSSDAAYGDYFSQDSVAVGCNRIVIGASLADTTGLYSNAGAAYIFDLDGNEIKKITADDVDDDDRFGASVAVGCGRIVVGSWLNDNRETNAGAAYIFDLEGNQLAKITAFDGDENDYFGSYVAVGSGRIVVGSPNDDDDGSASGSAYIYDLDGNFIAKIKASDGAANDYFGEVVAVGNGRIVAGAFYNDEIASNAGAAYIFDLDGTQLAKITVSDGNASDSFGRSVAVGNGRIVVGIIADDDVASNAGAAYIYNLGDSQDTTFEQMLAGYGKE